VSHSPQVTARVRQWQEEGKEIMEKRYFDLIAKIDVEEFFDWLDAQTEHHAFDCQLWWESLPAVDRCEWIGKWQQG